MSEDIQHWCIRLCGTLHLVGHEHVQLCGALLQHADALLQAAQASYAALPCQLHQQCLDLHAKP